MNTTKPLIIVILIIVLGGISFVYFGDDKDSNKNMGGDSSMMENVGNDEMMEGEGEMMVKGSYETYSPEKLAKANDGDVVLFFRASWCPTCRALDANIRSNLGNIPSNLTILDVDYDNSASLKQKYGVTYQHTLVQVDADGNLIKKWTGSSSLSAVISEVN